MREVSKASIHGIGKRSLFPFRYFQKYPDLYRSVHTAKKKKKLYLKGRTFFKVTIHEGALDIHLRKIDRNWFDIKIKII